MPSSRNCEASAAPVAAAIEPPTIAEAAEHAVLEVDHVHRAGSPAAKTGLAAEHLGEQPLGSSRGASSDAVAAVGRGDASSGSSAVQTPTATASSPWYRWIEPSISFARKSRWDSVLEEPNPQHGLVAALKADRRPSLIGHRQEARGPKGTRAWTGDSGSVS